MRVTTWTIFREYLRSLKRYRALVTFIVVMVAIASMIEVAVPLFYKRFFDVLSGPAASYTVLRNTIVTIAILNGCIWLLYRLAAAGEIYLMGNMNVDLIQRGYDYLQFHSFRFFSNSFVGSLVKKVTRFNRSFETIEDKILWNLYPLALRIIAVVAVLFTVHRTIAIILLMWTLLFLFFNYWFAVWKLPYDERRAAKDSEITGVLADAITNHSNIHLFSGFRFELARLQNVANQWRKLRVFTWSLEQVMESAQFALAILVEFGLMALALRYWRDGLLGVGTFVLLQTYFIQLFIRLWDFGRNVRNIYEALADAREMVEVLYTPHEITNAPAAKMLRVESGHIELKKVTFSYHQTRTIIHGIDLAIAGGQKVALIGPSGSGKSTIVKLLFRLYEIDSGKLLIDEQNIQKVTQESLHSALSLVPQDPILFHRTLMENIRYGRRDATDAEVIRAATLAHCHEFINDFPNGYETFVGERGVKLSGGERQRVAIARAILRDAPILVLDEATSSLDSHSEALIQDALKNLMHGKTTIVIAHRLSTIQQMDRIVVLDHGRIVEQGSHASLLKTKGSMYQKLWKIQAGGFLVDEEEEQE
ncbi:ABC transporter ATP-binding protein [Candidatus Uhrbacteria bacterium]|nr:ABC transporter ATP-binding protein [Candidatus Uhrbacteria bacterium]